MYVTIRRSEPSEAARLTEIARAAKRHWGYPEEYIRLWADDLTLTPEYVGGNAVYSAVCGDRVVGVCALTGEGETREIDHLWVDPGHIGRGVGRLLFRHAVEKARAEGVLTLEIVADPNAEGFYLKMGARRIGEVPAVPPGRVLPLLVLDLRPPDAP